MTLDQLRVFVAVAEREHVTHAAEALHRTQSATSAAIAALEGRHAVRLFDRIGRRIVLTQAGHSFLIEARAVLARAALAERVLDDLAGMKRGALHLAASQTVSNYWLPPLMHRFHNEHPGVVLSLEIGNTDQTVLAVLEARADLGFIEGHSDDPALSMRIVKGDQLALVVPQGHVWADTPPACVGDLAASPWVLREPGSGTREELEVVLARAGLTIADLDIALELPSNEAVCAAVEAGAGAGALSTLVVRPSLAAGSILPVRFELPQRAFHVLWHRERHLTQAEHRFMALAGVSEK